MIKPYDIDEISPFFINTTTKNTTIKKDLKLELAQKIITFDIETTSIAVDKDTLETYDYIHDPVRNDKSLTQKKRDKIIKKKLDNCYMISFMYSWQITIVDEEDDVVYESFYGRHWSEFQDFISFLKSFDCTFVIWVFNLGFEFEYLRNMFEWDEQFFTHKHAPIWVMTDNVIFRCAYKMVGMSLRTTLENWDCEHKKIDGDDFNYDLYRHSKTELSDLELLYIEYDVLGLAEYLMKKWDSIRYRNNKRPSLWKMPLTVTGEPRKAIKDEIKNEHLKGKLYPKISDATFVDYEDYLTVKCAMKGGYTHCNPRYYSLAVFADPSKGVHIFSRDKTSFYPYVMLTQKFPMKMNKIDDASIDIDLENEDYATIFTVHFKGLKLKPDGFPYHSVHKGFVNGKTKDLCFSALSHDIESQGARCIVDNGKLIYADDVVDIITDLDWKVYKENYTWESCEKYNAMQGKKERLPLPYLLSILTWYQQKTIYKGDEENLVVYQNSKGKVNAIFGMSCTDPCKISIYYLDGRWIDGKEEKDFNIKTYTEDKLREIVDGYKELRKDQLCNLYQWGCYITAYCRSILMEHNKYLGILCVLYNDTDSTYYIVYSDEEMKRINDYFENYHNTVIHKELRLAMEYINIEIEKNRSWDSGKPKPLTMDSFAPKNKKGEAYQIGRMDIEHEIKAFKSLGAKRYCYIYYDEKKDCDVVLPTVAGITKNDMRKYLIEEVGEKQFYSRNDMEHIMDRFTNDTYVGMFESGKQCIHYHEEMPDADIYVTDHNGVTDRVEILTGACFMKIPFSMKENNKELLNIHLDDMLEQIDNFEYN